MVNVKIVTKMKRDTQKGIKNGYLEGLKETLAILEEETKNKAPVKTGFLKNSVMTQIKRIVGYMIVKADYAIYQEEGTYKMAAANHGAGFVKPAVAYVRTKISSIFSEAIRKNIRSQK